MNYLPAVSRLPQDACAFSGTGGRLSLGEFRYLGHVCCLTNGNSRLQREPPRHVIVPGERLARAGLMREVAYAHSAHWTQTTTLIEGNNVGVTDDVDHVHELEPSKKPANEL